MMKTNTDLLVSLGDLPVGTIRARETRISFVFLSEYLGLPHRLVLGQYFEDHLADPYQSRQHLPPFFSNLLPEGGLRELVARTAGVNADQEAELISLLGEDLPGAVVVRPYSGDDSDIDDVAAPSVDDTPQDLDGALRFSLAGAQLKFSVLYNEPGRGPTVPINGLGGNWIAKLPSETYERVPENEYAMLLWAKRVGIMVPEVRLMSVADIDGLPVRFDPTHRVFLSRRFDRPETNRRVHQEDFAQIANVSRARRYGELSYSSIARIVKAVCGEEDYDEVIRRLAFNILIGNGDAHLKNWSLIYPDGIHARLSPAYDLVSTIAYIPGDRLALRLARENRFDAISTEHFRRLAGKTGTEPERVLRIVKETVERAMSTWPGPELDEVHNRSLRAHVKALKLLREI
jgi:serine/threonine-protein kinase HipA